MHCFNIRHNKTDIKLHNYNSNQDWFAAIKWFCNDFKILMLTNELKLINCERELTILLQ